MLILYGPLTTHGVDADLYDVSGPSTKHCINAGLYDVAGPSTKHCINASLYDGSVPSIKHCINANLHDVFGQNIVYMWIYVLVLSSISPESCIGFGCFCSKIVENRASEASGSVSKTSWGQFGCSRASWRPF